MELKVIGMGCKDCDKLYENTVEAVSELQMDAKIEKVEDLVEIVRLGVMSAPALMADGKILSAGRALKTKEIEKLLRKQ